LPKISNAEREELNAELWKRACATITPAKLAGEHPKQLEILSSKARNILMLCSRRAGKTEAACRMLVLTMMALPNVACLYLALVGPQAKVVWRRKWLPLLRDLKIPAVNEELDMVTTFPNGSTVRFGGVDDARHVASMLGDSMAGGLAIIDEAQSQPEVVKELAEDVLEPMLSETTAEKPVPGRMVIQGTIPKIKAGYFMDTWMANLVDGKIANGPGREWELWNFSRFDNPYLTNNRQALENTMRKYGWAEDHPTIQRDWFGRWDIEDDVTAIHYRKERAGWQPELLLNYREDQLAPGKLICGKPPDGVDLFAIGLDPAATADRFVVQVIGWGRGVSGVFHMAEWATEKAADARESQWIEVIKFFKERYGRIVRVIRDAGSATTTNDMLYRSHGIIIEPALKGGGSLRARVDRLDDLVSRGEFRIIVGSKLEEDCKRAMWSQKQRALGKWAWDPSWHPDALDAASYALPAFLESAEQRKQNIGAQLPPDIAAYREAENTFRKQFIEFKPTATAKPRDSRMLWRKP